MLPIRSIGSRLAGDILHYFQSGQTHSHGVQEQLRPATGASPVDLLAVPSIGSPSPSLVNNKSSSPPSPSGYIVTVEGQASPLTEHVPKLPGRSTSMLGNNDGTEAPAEAPIPHLQPEPAPSVLSQGQGI